METTLECVDPQEEEATQIALHAVRNMIGSERQLSLFDEEKVKEFAEQFGVSLGREITEYGIDLTEIQVRMMEAILYGFTKTKYKGNLDPVDKPSLAKVKYPAGSLPSSYKYFTKVPKLKISQSQLLQWARVNQRSAGDIQVALRALKHLGTTQYCFYYTRLAFDEEGNPKKDRDGDWQKEEIVAVDTLFTIKEVRNKKTSVLEYYEIIPSSIFLDQRESYYMLIPFNWREEINKLVGQRKASSYTFRFILFLRYRYELERRNRKEKKIFTLKYTPEEMAIHLKMPESVYRRKKDRMNKILDEVYSVAKQLGYLKNYERTNFFDFLYLNEEKYQMPRHEEKLLPATNDKENASAEMVNAKELLNFMIDERKKIDKRYNPVSGGHVREQSLKNLVELLKDRPVEEIKKVFLWGIQQSFWISRVGTPAKLRANFDDAVAEMILKGNKENPQNREQKNKEIAKKIAQQVNGSKDGRGKPIKIELLNQTVEIRSSDESYPACIKYSDHGFEEQLTSALRKRGINL